MTRTSTTLIGAGIGVAAALVSASYNSTFGGAYPSADWIAHGIGYLVPWALVGGAIGFFSGKKKEQS